jgi:hypothetical protein
MANEPTRTTWRGVRDIMGAIVLLVGIMFSVSLSIAAVVFLVLVLVHVLSG